jgi:hypothetical protein
VAAFHLPSRVFEALALALAEGSLADSSLCSWVKTRVARFGMSLSKPQMGEIKVSKAVIQTNEI